ncbi:hypothetical protein BJQ89_01516 [Arthrobacter sp. ES1]|nr:hypothetical protein [Arthrobacter sp. ES1]
MMAPASSLARRSAGTAMAFLMCTTPRMSSDDSPIIGNREYPVRRAASTMSETGWWPSIVSILMRGVITSAAVRPENLSVRSMKLAVPASRVPIAAERRTREASSAGVRAPEISSLASRPKIFRTLLEKPLSTTMAGLKIAVKISCGRASALPTWKDSAIAIFFGTSSPISMDSRVAKAIARTRDTEDAAAAGNPRAASGASSSLPTDGSIT